MSVVLYVLHQSEWAQVIVSWPSGLERALIERSMLMVYMIGGEVFSGKPDMGTRLTNRLAKFNQGEIVCFVRV
ncbi:MAG TPA: hypothetical protein DDW52_19100 [Planctomycetaceae bacterium]|nr:hypothetical protein [Planctomycetaceae bacterium]